MRSHAHVKSINLFPGLPYSWSWLYSQDNMGLNGTGLAHSIYPLCFRLLKGSWRTSRWKQLWWLFSSAFMGLQGGDRDNQHDKYICVHGVLTSVQKDDLLVSCVCVCALSVSDHSWPSGGRNPRAPLQKRAAPRHQAWKPPPVEMPHVRIIDLGCGCRHNDGMHSEIKWELF